VLSLLAVTAFDHDDAPATGTSFALRQPWTLPSCAELSSARGCVGARTARYVSPAGSDSNPGTPRRPWRTLRRAMATLRPGQTAFLRAGVYEEGLGTSCGSAYNALNWARSGTASAPITISGNPGERRRVIVRTAINMRGHHQRLLNLVVDRNSAYSSFDDECNGSLNVRVWGDHDEVRGVEIRNARMSGLYLSGADHARILGNWIHDNGTHQNLDHGIYHSSGTDVLIANNVIERNYAYGAHLYSSPQRTVLVHNTLVRNRRAGIFIGGDEDEPPSGTVVANNISAFNGEYGLRTYWDGAVGANNVAIRNLLHGNGTSPSYLDEGGLTERESIHAVPGFRDMRRRNYRLRANSPALGRAHPDYSVPVDRDGRRRPQGNGPDLGAYER
jgi:parallel beta-helix repeat protein